MWTVPGAVRALPFLFTIALLAGCGGGDGSALSGATATRPAPTATRPGVTATRPQRTQPTVTATTPEPTEPTVSEPIADVTVTQTAEAPTVTLTETNVATETQVQTETQITLTLATQAPETTAQTESVAATSSSDDTPWGWILLGAAVLVAAVLGLLAVRNRRAAGVALERRADDLQRRVLTTLDDVRLQGSIVTGRVQALAAEARSLERSADDDHDRRRLASLAAGLDALGQALETDRNLRLATPPPTDAQLNYSTSLIRRHVDEVDAQLRPPAAPSAPPSN